MISKFLLSDVVFVFVTVNETLKVFIAFESFELVRFEKCFSGIRYLIVCSKFSNNFTDVW